MNPENLMMDPVNLIIDSDYYDWVPGKPLFLNELGCHLLWEQVAEALTTSLSNN